MLCTQFEKKSLLIIVFVLLSFAPFAKAQTKITEGSLEVFDDKGKTVGLCPLKHTDVKAEISGFIARVTVTQEFTNPFDKKIEAVYAFPMSQNAAVDDMTMIIGDRIVRGKIMKREEATATYNQAKAEGKVASLLEQQRPNMFTQSVANIVPNAQIKIVISYVEYLKYDSGSYEFVFPMTIGERYIPMSQEMSEDTSKITPSHLERPGHDISLEVKIDAGVPLVSIASSNHKVESTTNYSNESLVRLENENEIPNKDFVLRYKVAGEKIQDALLVYRDQRGGFFTLILQPPDRVMPEDVNPKEIVFVLDTSGSMSGFPIEKAKESMKLALDGLYPRDTFNLITFAGDTSILFDKPVPATKENLDKAQKFLATREGGGGTEMMKAIKAALDPSDSQQHLRIVCFMTDGYVGNDMEIVGEIQKHPNARVFSFGIGSSVNRYLLDKMSEEGRGEVEYVSLQDDGSAAAKRFHERIRNPLLTDVSIAWNGLPVADVYPQKIPDLFSAKPVVLTGRFTQSGKGTIRLKGMMAGNYFEREIPVEFPEQEAQHDVLSTLWARQRVDDLMKQDYAGAQNNKMKVELKNEITQIGIEFRLLTQFTSFVAVDESSYTGSNEAEKVSVDSAAPNNALMNGLVGTTNETVMVVGGGELIQTENATVGTTVTGRQVADIPTASRDALDLVMAMPGTATGGRPRTSGVNGLPKGALNVTLDGVNVQDNLLKSADGFFTYIRPRIDAIAEATVSSATLGAESTGEGETQINFVTKSGTNEFHGSLFNEFGNGVFNANNFFANNHGLQKPSGKSNFFGGTLGGPVQRDRHFFFVAFENRQMRQSVFALTEVPSLSSRINSPLLNAFPLPNGANTANGFSEFASNFLNPVSQNDLTFRYDWNITNNLYFSSRYAFANSNGTTRGEDGFSLNTNKRTNKNANMLKGELRYMLSSSLVAEISADYSNASLEKSYSLDNFGGANVTGVQSFFTGNQTFSKFDFFGKNALLGVGPETVNSLQKLEIKNDWTKVAGTHSINFGFSLRHRWFVVGTQPTEQSILLGGAMNSIAERVNLFNRVSKLHPRFTDSALYVNDTWRVSPNFTLNLGMRWEVSTPPSNSDDEKPLALIDKNQINFAPKGTSLWNTTYNNFSPRIGLAWSLGKGRQTVLRGGFGLYYENGNTENVFQVFKNSFPFVHGTVSLPNNPATTNNLFVGFDPKLKLPYTMRWNLSFEREVFDGSVFGVHYISSQGQRLFLTKTFVGQDPNFALVRLTTNDAESDYHALLLSFESANFKGFDAKLSYTFAKSLDNYSSDSPFAAIAVSENPRQDRAASDFDMRHKFSGIVSYSTPKEFGNEKLSLLMRDWTFSSLFNLRSALPMNVFYARVNSFGVTYWRPDLLANTSLYLNNPQEINANAFAIPNSLRQGTLGRNSLRGFPLYQFDFAVSRTFNIKQDVRLMLKLAALNVLNHPNFAAPVGSELSIASSFPSGVSLSNPTFGKATSLLGNDTNSGARALQVSFKLMF